ncbi:hypothetical protein SNA_29965 [Streptomyces natalensis ATCC 27448]|uniref:Uncharacterized protein n=1 Tax=Streptomyces natalensis ATCC 27448 TaxID=1240678 RepID=A0A0D7CFB5_9ACTN|nr:hypothetical protein SNA_29965 [Streptomyces natalensis ATCC 27448]
MLVSHTPSGCRTIVISAGQRSDPDLREIEFIDTLHACALAYRDVSIQQCHDLIRRQRCPHDCKVRHDAAMTQGHSAEQRNFRAGGGADDTEEVVMLSEVFSDSLVWIYLPGG